MIIFYTGVQKKAYHKRREEKLDWDSGHHGENIAS